MVLSIVSRLYVTETKKRFSKWVNWHQTCRTFYTNDLTFYCKHVFQDENTIFFELLQTLAALLITKQVVGNVKEALVPFVKQKVKEWKQKKKLEKEKKELEKKGVKPDVNKNKELDTPLMNQAEIESNMPEYEVGTDKNRTQQVKRPG